MMSMYKKTIMAALVSVSLLVGGIAFAERCAVCGGDPVVKQSLEDALAKLNAANAAAEAEKEEAKLEKCGCSKPKPKPPVVTPRQSNRADRDDRDDAVQSGCSSCCSAMIKVAKQLKKMHHDSQKCCSKIKDKIDDIGEMAIAQIEQAAACCSTNEVLIVSLIEPLALTVSLNEILLNQISTTVNQIFNCTCT